MVRFVYIPLVHPCPAYCPPLILCHSSCRTRHSVEILPRNPPRILDPPRHPHTYTLTLLFPPFPLFFLSASHLSTHLPIFPLEFSLPTLTVAIILPQSNDIAKHVNSKNELCSEYGTPYICSVDVEFFIGLRFAYVNDNACDREMTV